MSRTSAFHFLCECLSCIPDARQPVFNFDDDFSWTIFIALTHEYRVSSMMAGALNRLPSSSSLPNAVRLFFSGIATHHRQRNELVRVEAIEVAQILNGIGVRPLFMKGGAHLLTDLYPDIAMRQVSDLDILVPAERINDCVAALGIEGITQLTDYQHPRAHHHPQLGRTDLPVPIELHHRVLAYPHCDFLPAEEMGSAPLEVAGHGVNASVPTPTIAVIHNIAHAQLSNHDCIYGRLDLRGLLDLALLSNARDGKIDWDQVNSRFVDAGWRQALEYHLQWARRLGAKIPSSRVSAASKLLCRRAAYQVHKPKLMALSVRALRPFILLRRELSDSGLRRRLMRNAVKLEWWKRHLRMVKDG
jgi:hypothetical protein